MKNLTFRSGLFLISVYFLASCAASHSGYMQGSASLSSNNFRYVKTNVFASAQCIYFLGLGGYAHEALVGEAKQNLYLKSGLKNNQAYANITVNWKTQITFLGFIVRRVCTVSADIVEFNSEQGLSSGNSIVTEPEGLSSGNSIVTEPVDFRVAGRYGTIRIEEIENGSIWIFAQNYELYEDEIIAFLIGNDRNDAIKTFEEMLNTLTLAKGDYALSNGIEVTKKGARVITLKMGNKPTDGYTWLTKEQCEKAITKLNE